MAAGTGRMLGRIREKSITPVAKLKLEGYLDPRDLALDCLATLEATDGTIPLFFIRY